jgi:hypothetical protein
MRQAGLRRPASHGHTSQSGCMEVYANMPLRRPDRLKASNPDISSWPECSGGEVAYLTLHPRYSAFAEVFDIETSDTLK